MAKTVGDPQSSPKTAAIAGERRQVTALFYDIVGSTELLQRLDPEDFARLQRQVHGEAAAAIRANGGHLDRLAGDGGAAYFGFPISSEDAVECAVVAALDMVARFRNLGTDADLGTALQVRVGVATGMVVIAEMKDTALPGLEEVIGITPALAARMQSEAEPNSVVVSDATYRLTRGVFEYEPLGLRSLKGFAESVRLWKPVARRPQIDRFSSSRHASTPLIGRADELDLCRRRWARAQSGEGQLVMIVGEAGIGKSRLVAELSHELSSSACQIRIFQCLRRGNSRPLHPFIDMLRRDIRGEAAGPSALAPAEIRSSVQAGGASISDEAAAVLAFLSGGDNDNGDGGLSPADLSADKARRRALDAVFEVLVAWSCQKPQLIVIEDVHWADTLTQAVIAEVPERIATSPVLAVVTARSDSPVEALDDPNALTITLSRLDAKATPQLLQGVWNGTPPPRLASFIHDKSDGIPLFAEELARLLQERFQNGDSDVKDWDRALRKSGIVTLQDLLSARLSGLGKARRVAQVASVIGREFQADLLSLLTDGESAQPSLGEALSQLVQAGILRHRGVGDATVYRFRHVLLQEAAYDSLLKADRREMHRRVVDLVTSGAVAAPPDEIVAWHCEQAERFLDAALYAIRAADGCAMRSATWEADRLLASAETYLGACKPGPATDELLLELLMIRGPVASALCGPGSQEARSAYEQGVALCRRLEVADPEKWFPLYWGWWFTSPDFGTQRGRAEALIHFAERAAEAEIKLQALHCAWATDFNIGQYADCLCRIERGMAFYDSGRGIRSRGLYGGHDAKVCALAERGLCLWFTGEIEAADDSVQAALDLAGELDHPASLCHALDFALMLRRYQNDPEGAAALARRMEEVAETHGLVGAKARSRIFAGWASAVLGALDEGLQQLEEGLAKQKEIGTEEDFPVYFEMQAELLGRLGRPESGIQVLDTAIDRSGRVGHMFWIPELYRRRALLRHAAGQESRLWTEDLNCALAEADRRGARTLASRARDDLARLSPSSPT